MVAIQIVPIVLVLGFHAAVVSALGVFVGEGPGERVGAPLQFSDAELRTLKQGRPVVKTMEPSMNRELVTAGGVRIRGQLTRFAEQFKTLDGFRTSQFVLQLGKFAEMPGLSDLDGLTLDSEDLDSLRVCRVGACDVKLAADDIRRFEAEVNWSSPTAAGEAATLYKEILFAHLSAYREGGHRRLIDYHDGEERIRLGVETGALFEARPSLLDLVPGFQSRLHSDPAGREGVEHLFYWSKEAFGFKPVTGLTHLRAFVDESTGYAVIVTTQIYASHYIDGSVAIHALVPDASGPEPGFYWLYQNRSRVGRLAGVLGALSRPIVQRRARAGLMRSLVQTKSRFERD